jgi:hypothetical protein
MKKLWLRKRMYRKITRLMSKAMVLISNKIKKNKKMDKVCPLRTSLVTEDDKQALARGMIAVLKDESWS